MLNRRLIRLAAPLVLGAVALAACGDGEETGKSGGDKTYKIAFQGPISGDNAAIGENEGNGVKLAIDLANAKGDLGFKLEYVGQDDLGTAEGGPPAARKSIDDEDVIAVVGPAFSGATKASGALFSAAKLVTVSPSATGPALTTLGFSSFFRVVPPDFAQGDGSAEYLAKVLKVKKVYSINDKSEYGVGLAGVLEEKLAAANVATVKEGVPITKDYSTVSQKVKNSGADAVYYSGYYPEFALLSKALKGVGFTGAMMSGDGSNDDEYITQATAAVAEGVYLTCPCTDPNVDPKSKTFVDAYQKAFNKAPGTYSAEAFDAANTIIEAMKAAGDDLTREKVLEAVRSIKYTGITKEIAFTDKGEVADNAVYMWQVKGGKRVVLGLTKDLAK